MIVLTYLPHASLFVSPLVELPSGQAVHPGGSVIVAGVVS